MNAAAQSLPRAPTKLYRMALSGHCRRVELFLCVARAPEGGVPLEPYPNVHAWLARVEALPGFLPFIELPRALAA